MRGPNISGRISPGGTRLFIKIGPILGGGGGGGGGGGPKFSRQVAPLGGNFAILDIGKSSAFNLFTNL